MAAIQPWSAPGALNAILTVPSVLPPEAGVPPDSAGSALPPPSSSSSLLHAATPRASSRQRLSVMTSLLRDIVSPSLWGQTCCEAGGSALTALDQDSGEDDHPLRDLLDLDREIHEREQVEDQGEGDDAEERADDARPAAREARTADYHRGDGV